MAGTSPAVTAEKHYAPKRGGRDKPGHDGGMGSHALQVPLVTSLQSPNLGKTGDSGLDHAVDR